MRPVFTATLKSSGVCGARGSGNRQTGGLPHDFRVPLPVFRLWHFQICKRQAVDYARIMLVQTKHRFSVKQYYRMAETGVLPANARVELLDGQIVDMSPIGPFHGGVTNALLQFFVIAAKNRWLVAVQNPVRLDDFSEPQPDLALLKPTPDSYRSRHPGPDDVILLIEISDSTLQSDREEKLPTYGRAGIAEVWIVNLVDKTIEIHREPNFADYASRVVLSAGDMATPLAFPDAAVDVALLLQR